MDGFLSRLFPCLSKPSTTLGLTNPDQVPHRGKVHPFCTFCKVSTETGFAILWQDHEFIAFRDRRPAAQHHILVIPIAHIPSVKTLRHTDAALVLQMEQIGHRLLDDLGVSRTLRRMGFHIPPFNSVNHLHLHVLALPYVSRTRRAKYPVSPSFGQYHKGFSWFVEVSQAVKILEDGGKIRLPPC
ncbi:HIT-like protein [Infundibulicybe gibba]|nr:HIT-like protein [Infundibulicybe gibba]